MEKKADGGGNRHGNHYTGSSRVDDSESECDQSTDSEHESPEPESAETTINRHLGSTLQRHNSNVRRNYASRYKRWTRSHELDVEDAYDIYTSCWNELETQLNEAPITKVQSYDEFSHFLFQHNESF